MICAEEVDRDRLCSIAIQCMRTDEPRGCAGITADTEGAASLSPS